MASADTAIRQTASGSVLGLMLICSLLWATAFPLMKLIGADLSPLALNALRGTMGCVLLGLFLLAKRQSVLPKGREWLDWMVLGIFQGLIPNVLTAYALLTITTGLSSMIQASTPLIVALVAHFLFADERLTPLRAVGVLTGFAGIALLIGPAAFGVGAADFNGTIAMAITAASYAIGNLYIRGIPDANPTRLAFGQQTFSGLPSLAFLLAWSGTAAFAGVQQHLWEVLALGFVSTAIPILLYMHILKRAGPTLGSMNGYLVPVWTILIGVTLLHETVLPREILGGVVIFAGITIVSVARRRALRAATG
ncbi:MAG TPA: DMT family transporter [Rhizobiaceae bacterium]|nr:DMT family transporter [Rhizobiaceae bacterium]